MISPALSSIASSTSFWASAASVDCADFLRSFRLFFLCVADDELDSACITTIFMTEEGRARCNESEEQAKIFEFPVRMPCGIEIEFGSGRPMRSRSHDGDRLSAARTGVFELTFAPLHTRQPPWLHRPLQVQLKTWERVEQKAGTLFVHENASIYASVALQALFHSLSPEDANRPGEKLSSDQVRKLSDKLGEILGDQDIGELIGNQKRNEKGEVRLVACRARISSFILVLGAQ